MARTNDVWETGIGGGYIQTIAPAGFDILINGSNHYINFATTVGSFGYGIRDNSGVMEFKNSGGSWTGFGSGGGITSITAGIGLTGGTITTSGTIALDQTRGNIWTGATTFAPSATNTVALTVKQKSGSSVNLFDIQNPSAVSQFYVDSSLTFNVANDMKFRNIAGGSLVALNSSNVLIGINTLTNISYNPTSSIIKAVPSGSTTQYQFNNSGNFAGNAHATQDSSDSSSTFVGLPLTVATPTGFTGAIVYADTGTYMSGYSTTGNSIGYKVYSYALNPVDGTKYYDATPASVVLTDDNSTLTCDPATGATVMQDTSTGSYIANGQTFTYYIWAFQVLNGVNVYATLQAVCSYTDFINDGVTTFQNNIDWAPPTPHPSSAGTSFVIQRDINGGGFVDFILEGAGFNDDGTNAGWTLGASPGLAPTVTQNFYQVSLSWNTVPAAVGYKLFYSPNNFYPNSTQYATFLATPTANYASTAYLNATLDYQVWAWQVISSVKIYSSSSLTLSMSDMTGNPFGVDISFTAPIFDPSATSTGYTLQRNISSAGYLDYKDIASTSVFDDGSAWTSGTPVLSPTTGPHQFSVDLGNVTSAQDDSHISWTNDYTITPTSVGPFGATIGNSTAGITSAGPINVNSSYIFSSLAPSVSIPQVQVSQALGPLLWANYRLQDIPGLLQGYQIAFGTGGTGQLLYLYGSTPCTESFTFDIGNLFHTMRVPTVLAYEQGLQLSAYVGAAQHQIQANSFSTSANTCLLFYNIQGGSNTYGIKALQDGDRNNWAFSENVITRPDVSALIDMQSTTKGFIEPKMTTTQRNAISSPADGLQVYDVTIHQPFYYNNSAWKAISSTTGTVTSVAFSVPATSIFGTSGSPVTTSGTLGLTTTGTSGGIPYFSSTSVVSSSALLTANALVLGGGAGVAPTVLGSLGTTTTVLHGNAAGAPSFGAVSLTADVSGILPVANGGTGASTLVGAGVVGVVTNVQLTNQSADITSTNFSNTSTAGLYRISYSLEDTTSDITAGAVTITIAYTATAGAITVPSSAQVLTGSGLTQGTIFAQLASGSISYSTTHTGLFGTAKYALYMTVERLV